MDVSKLNPIAKAVAAFITGLLTVLALFVTLSNDGVLSTEDVMALIIALIGAIGGTTAVYQTPNKTVDGTPVKPLK